MAEVFLEARHILIGDSFWSYPVCAELQESGDAVTVVCRPDNAGVFEFIRDYGCNTDRIKVLPIGNRYMGPTISRDGGPGLKYFPDGVMTLRRELTPIATHGQPYMCFQPESAAHAKRRLALKEIRCRGVGYSIGVMGEYVIGGTDTFHSRSISDVARLIYHSRGAIAVYSSIALFSCMLGKKVLCVGYEGISIGKDTAPTGHPRPRCRFEEGDANAISQAALEHFGPCLEGHPV